MYKVFIVGGKSSHLVLATCADVMCKKQQKFESEKNPVVLKHSKCLDRNEEAMDNVKELQEKHSNKYSAEQYNAWAQLNNIRKHQSFDEPPDHPFFQGRKGKSDSMNTSATASYNTSFTSPTKRDHYPF